MLVNGCTLKKNLPVLNNDTRKNNAGPTQLNTLAKRRKPASTHQTPLFLQHRPDILYAAYADILAKPIAIGFGRNHEGLL